MELEQEPVRLRVDLTQLTDHELDLVDQQAERILGPLIARGRTALWELFAVIQGTAIAERYNRAGGQKTRYVAEARPDETAPLSHQATDLGYAMALVMPPIESAESTPAVRRMWQSVLRAMGAELRRRGPPA